MNKLKKFYSWLFSKENIIINDDEDCDIKIENCKNSKIIINGKVVFDDTKNE